MRYAIKIASRLRRQRGFSPSHTPLFVYRHPLLVYCRYFHLPCYVHVFRLSFSSLNCVQGSSGCCDATGGQTPQQWLPSTREMSCYARRGGSVAPSERGTGSRSCKTCSGVPQLVRGRTLARHQAIAVEAPQSTARSHRKSLAPAGLLLQS